MESLILGTQLASTQAGTKALSQCPLGNFYLTVRKLVTQNTSWSAEMMSDEGASEEGEIL